MSSLKDIATRTGFGIATVSRALNGHPNVRSDTRRKILRAAADLDYQTNLLGRALRTRRSAIAGLAVPRLTEPVASHLAGEIQRALSEHGYSLVLHLPADADGAAGPHAGRHPPRCAMDGMIALIGADPTPTYASVPATALPTVVIADRSPGLSCDTVIPDDRDGIEQLMRHLLQLGHRRFVIACGNSDGTPCRARITQMQAILAAADAASPAVVDGLPEDIGGLCAALNAIPAPTAMIILEPALVPVLLAVLQVLQIGIPQRLSVAVLGGPVSAWGSAAALTYVDVPLQEIARSAVRLLLDAIKDTPLHANAPVSIRIGGALVVGSSTARASS